MLNFRLSNELFLLEFKIVLNSLPLPLLSCESLMLVKKIPDRTKNYHTDSPKCVTISDLCECVKRSFFSCNHEIINHLYIN